MNAVRYKMYCAKRCKCEANQLPTCKSSLQKHEQGTNYHYRIRGEAFALMVNIPDHVTYGWKVEMTGHLRLTRRIIKKRLRHF